MPLWNSARSWLGFCVAFTSELQFRHCAFWLLLSTCKVIPPLSERSKIHIQHADSEEIFEFFGQLMLLLQSKGKKTKMNLLHLFCDHWRFNVGSAPCVPREVKSKKKRTGYNIIMFCSLYLSKRQSNPKGFGASRKCTICGPFQGHIWHLPPLLLGKGSLLAGSLGMQNHASLCFVLKLTQNPR